MNKLTGYLEKKIGGKVRRFKFGTNSSAILCELEGCGLGEIQERIKTSAWFQHHMVMAAAISYCRSVKEDVDFTKEDIGDWMDELRDNGELQDLFDAMGKANEGPNIPAPQQTKRAERREVAKKVPMEAS